MRLERSRNNLKNGYFREYSPKGILLNTSKYIDGELIVDAQELVRLEIETEFFDNAKPRLIKSFKNGVPEGIWKEYNDTGKIVNSYVYSAGLKLGEGVVDEAGIKEGPWKEYYPDGVLRSEGEYKAGLRFGLWKFYYPSSKLEEVGKYTTNERPDGLLKWYYENGQLLREETFIKGKEEGDYIEYDESGKVVVKGQYIEGLEEGEWISEEGDTNEVGAYELGMKKGIWTVYYDNGELSFEGEYSNGDPIGKHIYYYKNGRKMLEGKYEAGEKVGEWKRYNEDGTPLLSIEYNAGVEKRYDGQKINIKGDKKREF